MRWIYKLIFWLLGWKIQGDVPRKLKKYIIVVAPHTSNWDFFVGLAVRGIMRFPSNFLGKKELFNAPFGWIFRALGGLPVDRSRSSNLVDQVAELAKTENKFVVAIAPEGTRKKVDKWKTGFYHIAYQAGIPMVLAGIDYGKKTVFFREPMQASGNLETDARIIDNFFRDKKGKNGFAAPVLGKNS